MGLGDVSAATVPKVSLVAPPAARRRDLHPDLHPGPRAHLDRRARRGQRRHRAAARRRGRRRPRPSVSRARRGSTSSIPRVSARSRSRSTTASQPATVIRVRRGPHRPQALRRHRLPRQVPLTAPDRSEATATARPCSTSPTSGTSNCSPRDLDESLWFFIDLLGMTETGREGDSVYLRTWDDYEQYTIKLTAHETSGIGRTALRASSQEALERGSRRSRRPGSGTAGSTASRASGPPYLFRDPDGHEFALYCETERYAPPDELQAGAEEPGPGLPRPRRQRPPPRPRQLPRRRTSTPTATSSATCSARE